MMMWQLMGAGNCGAGHGKVDLEKFRTMILNYQSRLSSNQFKYYVLYVNHKIYY